jgi:MarR family transcriptional regulator for hemolysin
LDTDLRYQFSRSLTVTTRRWVAFLDKRLGELGLTGSRWYALVELSKSSDNPSQRELAALLGIEPASLVRILDRLSAAGLINRLPHDTDRRTKQIEITPSGKTVLAEISAVSAKVRDELLDGVAEEDLVVCLRVFRVIQGRLAKVAA